MKRMVLEIMLALLLVSTLSSTFHVAISTMNRDSSIGPEGGICEGDVLAQWNRTYGGIGYEDALSVVQTSDGGYAIAGYTASFGAGASDFWLVKTDANGNMEWNKTYGGTNADVAYSIIQTSDGGYALAGFTGPYHYYDLWFVKTDADGNMEWNKTFGGISNDVAHSVIQTVDGGYALAGWTESFGAGEGDFWLIKTDANGNMQWNKTYGWNEFCEEAFSIIQSNDGGYVMAGCLIDLFLHTADYWLVKTDMNGNMEWNRSYGGYPRPSNAIYSVIQTSDGGYTLAGRGEFLLFKTDKNGIIEWHRRYEGSYVDEAYSVVQTVDGGYALAGVVNWFGGDDYDFWLAKTDINGNMEWNATFGGPGFDVAYSIVKTSDGGYTMAGSTESFGAGYSDFWLVKFVPYHDVVVVDVSPSRTVVGQDLPVTINVTVENECFFSETVNVTVYADVVAPFGDEIIIGEQTNIHLAVGEIQSIQFQWDTIGLSKGNYTISAVASPVPDEIDIANNMCTAVVTIAIVGDIVPDGIVDIFDLVAVATWFGSTVPPAPPNSDIIEDKLIDIYDLVTVAIHYGETAP